MSLYFHRIQNGSEADADLIRNLYHRAFPEDELVPWNIFIRKAKRSFVDLWSISNDVEWIGFACLVKDETLAYLFFLAIDEAQRGRGHGHKVLRALRQRYAGQKLFLAREMLDPAADNYEERLRRHDFYLSCGLKDLPYHIKEAGVVYDIMGFDDPVEPEEYDHLMNRYAGPIGKLLVERRIIL